MNALPLSAFSLTHCWHATSLAAWCCVPRWSGSIHSSYPELSGPPPCPTFVNATNEPFPEIAPVRFWCSSADAIDGASIVWSFSGAWLEYKLPRLCSCNWSGLKKHWSHWLMLSDDHDMVLHDVWCFWWTDSMVAQRLRCCTTTSLGGKLHLKNSHDVALSNT